MVGKKLHYLIIELTASEKRLLYNASKNSNDKRDEVFIQLIKLNPTSRKDYECALSEISNQLNPVEIEEKERNKNLRRFVDFAAKRIENMKLAQLCANNQKIRNYLLAKVYPKNERNDLNERYYDKAYKESGNDYWVKVNYKNDQLEHVYKSQLIKDSNLWRGLIKEKETLLSNYYQREMASLIHDISRSYVDDPRSITDNDYQFKSSQDLEPLIAIAPGNVEKIIFRLAQARFEFKNNETFRKHLNEAESLYSLGVKKERDQVHLRRDILFLKFLHGFSNGSDWKQLEIWMSEVVEIDDDNNNWDPKMLFYLFLMYAIIGKDSSSLKAKYSRAFEKENAQYLLEFTDAVFYISEGDHKSAKRILTEIAYCNNPYISLWSRLLEITVNYNQGNIRFAENLVARAKRQLKLEENRLFTIPSCIVFLNLICEKYDLPTYKSDQELASGKLSPIFQFGTKLL